MKRIVCIMVVWFLLSFSDKVAAQSTVVIGYLRDSMTFYPVAGGTITNWNSKKKSTTNGNGFFRIEAKDGDLIYAEASRYAYDTLRTSLLFNDTITIYLHPTGNVLPVVTVTSGYTKYQLDSISRIRTFLEARGTALHTVSRSNSSGFGIGLNLDRVFKDKDKNRKRQEELFEKTERFNYIEYRFPVHLVAYYTGLRGEELREFIYQYTPGYEWLRQHTSNEEVLWYINNKLKDYRKKAKA